MKSIIVYTKEIKAQNLYPKRIISPPTPNKCCPMRMEVLGRPRLDEQGRRFYYKRCKVCGFALRHFLDPVGTILTPAINDPKSRKSLPLNKNGVAGPASVPGPERRPPPAARKSAASRHASAPSLSRRSHPAATGRKSVARRRR